jgi:predicted transcriptional regulator
MRTLVDIPDEDIERLDALAAREKKSRAAEIREAVRQYLAQKADDRTWIDRAYGLWAHRDDIPDSVEYQRAIREDRTPYEDL